MRGMTLERLLTLEGNHAVPHFYRVVAATRVQPIAMHQQTPHGISVTHKSASTFKHLLR